MDSRDSSDDFPTRLDGLTPRQLASILLVDQRQRWRRERVTAEDYLRRFPELNTECAVDLVYGEFLLREQDGERPSWQEYARRFPHLADVVRQQVELHRALGDSTTSTVPDTAVEPTPPVLPGYEVLAFLGRGGMGVVYKARQRNLNRLVALKTLADRAATADQRQRFRAEAEAMARLQHPNVVQVFDVGDHAGCPYFAMELVDNISLERLLADGPLSPSRAAELVETLARAVEHAHQRGVIHRDLKPANVLLTADGTPKITDFGLAKRLDLPPGQTPSGAVLGTPSYLAPEQALGRNREVGPRSDVYALGAVLYECLTGRPPFQGRTILETLDQVNRQSPRPPRRWCPDVPADLEAICLRCLHKSPARRFRSAADLADALSRGRNALATGPRRPAFRLPLMAAAAALAGLLAAGTVLWPSAGPGPEHASPQPESRVPPRWLFHPTELEQILGEEHFRFWEGARSLTCSRDGRWLVGGTDSGTIRIWDLATGGEHAVLRLTGQANGMVHAAALSPDNQRLAAYWPATPESHVLRLWDLGGEEPRHIGDWPASNDWPRSLVFTPDQRTVIGATDNGTITAWDVSADPAPARTLARDLHPFGLAGLAILDDGRLLVVGSDGAAAFWELDGDKVKPGAKVEGLPKVSAIALSPDGHTVAAATEDQTLLLCNLGEGSFRLRADLGKTVTPVRALAFSADGRALYTAGTDRVLRRVVLGEDQPVASPLSPGPAGPVVSVAFSPDGRTLAACDPRGACLWDLSETGPASCRRLAVIPEDEPRLTLQAGGVAWSADGEVVAVGVPGRPVHVWSVKALDQPPQQVRLGGEEIVKCLAFDTRQRLLAFGAWTGGPTGGTVQVRPEIDGSFQGGFGAAIHMGTNALTFLPRLAADDPLLVVAGTALNDVKLYRVSGRPNQPIQKVAELDTNAKGAVTALAATHGDQPDPPRLALGWLPGTIQIWEMGQKPRLVETRESEAWQRLPNPVKALAFSPDGRRLAASDAVGRLVVWDEKGNELLRRQLSGMVNGLAFSPDGRRLATGNGNGTCYLLRLPAVNEP